MSRFLRRRIPNCLKSWTSARHSWNAVAALKESKKGPPGNTFVYWKEYVYQVVCGMYAHLTIYVAGGPGVNPEAVEADTAHDD